MTLDKEFAREIKREANGDGTREAKFAFLKKARDAAKMLSCTKVAERYDAAIKEYGRVAVGVCTAVTVWTRRDRLNPEPVRWAMAVLDIWTNRPGSLFTVYIDDGLHPTRIEEYAGSFIRLTTEEV